jgi:hypothetical protein
MRNQPRRCAAGLVVVCLRNPRRARYCAVPCSSGTSGSSRGPFSSHTA